MPEIISAKKAVSELESSRVFKEWKKDNSDSYLCHVFFLFGKKEQCQIGYYDAKKDLITSFDVLDDIKLGSAEKPFKPEDAEVKKVRMSDISLDFKEAIAIVEDLQKEKYPSEKPVEIIVILQNLKDHGTVFNVTHITHSFKTLNVKVDVQNGDIIDEQLVSIIQFGPDKAK